MGGKRDLSQKQKTRKKDPRKRPAEVQHVSNRKKRESQEEQVLKKEEKSAPEVGRK